jgi:hypothetical protein
MRSTRAKVRLENLENRALLTTTMVLEDFPTQVVNDKVGTVDVHVGLSSDPSDSTSTPVTATLTTSGGTAVPGVDYTPVRQTITLTPSNTSNPMATVPSQQVAIPILPGPASLGTRVLEVSILPSPGAPQGGSEYIVITHGTDTTSPYVVNSQALTQGGKVVAFSLEFSKPMAIGPVTNLANYVAVAPKSILEVAGAIMSPADNLNYTKNIPLKSATYDAANNTVYLVPVNPVKPMNKLVTKMHIAFQVGSPTSASFSNLADTSGNPIAGENTIMFSADLGSFAQYSSVVKASPSVLSYLFGTSTHAKPKGNARAAHKLR